MQKAGKAALVQLEKQKDFKQLMEGSEEVRIKLIYSSAKNKAWQEFYPGGNCIKYWKPLYNLYRDNNPRLTEYLPQTSLRKQLPWNSRLYWVIFSYRKRSIYRKVVGNFRKTFACLLPSFPGNVWHLVLVTSLKIFDYHGRWHRWFIRWMWNKILWQLW